MSYWQCKRDQRTKKGKKLSQIFSHCFNSLQHYGNDFRLQQYLKLWDYFKENKLLQNAI